MKKLITFILLVSIVFINTNVNAEELKKIDEKALDNLPTTFNIDKKESELYFGPDDYYYYKDVEPVIKASIEETLRKDGYDVSDLSKYNVNIHEVGYSYVDTKNIHKSRIVLETQDGSHTNLIEKEVNVRFKNSDDYNEVDKEYVENKLKEIKPSIFPSWLELPETKIIPPILISNDVPLTQIVKFDFKNIIDDKNIDIKTIVGGCGNDYDVCMEVYAFKNDILYINTKTYLVQVPGQTLNNGVVVAIKNYWETDDFYKEFAKEIEEVDKLTKSDYIIGCYELEALGETYKGMEIYLNVDKKYNGMPVKVFHKKSNGDYEILSSIVKDGKVAVTVDEFSPFMIVLDNKNMTPTNVNNAPNNAQTSSINIVFYLVIAVTSLAGIVYIIIKKRKIA